MSDNPQAEAPWPSYALPRGTVINGYRMERVLGSGGFGITYLARDLLQQNFAIKEYFPRQFAVRRELSVVAASAEDAPLFDECRERFLHEAQALVKLSRLPGANEGIVRVQTYFEAHGTCFLVMDYIEGTSLASVLREQPAGLPAPRVWALMMQLLNSIGIVHRAGLMHRDIKPANVILRDDGRPVLIDFGSSRGAATGQTTAYTQIYSGGYAPPEQMLGLKQQATSDIYAIGAVGYRTIGGTVVDALARQNALAGGRPDPQPPAAQLGAGRYAAALLAAIDAALSLDPTRRPQSAEAMAASLGPAEPAEQDTIVRPSAPASAAERPTRAVRGTDLVARAVVAVGVLVVAGAAYVVLTWPGRQPAPGPRDIRATRLTPPVTILEAKRQETPAPAAVASAPEPPHQLAAASPSPPASTPPTADAAPHGTAPAAPAPPAAPALVRPQQLALIVPPEPAPAPPPPAPSPLASPPPPAADSAPAGTAAGVSPVPHAPPAAPTLVQPQQQALIVPPAPAPAPPPPAPSPRERAQEAALSLPCSALKVSQGQDGLRVSGFSGASQDLDRFLGDFRAADNVTRIADRFACPPIAAVAAVVRATDNASLALRLPQREVTVGARLAVDVASALPTLYVDLYGGDGSVRHLVRSAPGAAARPRAEWVAAAPPGPRLVVAIGTSAPLDLGARPDVEKAADYLAVLQPRLQQLGTGAAADLAVATVRAPPPQSHPASFRPEKCANIVSRAQLGETLTDAELTALRTECRS